MPERFERLRHVLDELERELAAPEPLDAESRGVLAEAAREIQVALHQRDSGTLAAESLTERLRDAEQRFEASHPTLSGIVLRMIDALGQMGI